MVSKKLGKGYKFNPGTRQILSTMNMHLRGLDNVHYRNETQLVNDKTLEKQMSRGGQSFLRPAPFPNRLVGRKSAQQNKAHPTEKPRHVESNEGLSAELQEPPRDGNTPPRQTPTRKEEVKSRSKNSLSTVRAGSTVAETKGLSDASENSSNHSSKGPMRQFDSGVGTTKNVAHDGDPGLQSTKVRLRSVVDAVQPNMNNDNPPAWASVTLRKVRIKGEESKGPSQESHVSTKESFDEAARKSRTMDDINGQQEFTSSDSDGSQSQTDDRDWPSHHSNMRNKEAVEAQNELKTSTNQSKKSREDEPLIFKLRPEKASKYEQRLVIRDKSMMLAASTGGDRPPEVVWQTPLENAQPVAVDVPKHLVKLISNETGEEKELKFANPADCIQFMNLYYDSRSNDGDTLAEETTGDHVDDEFTSLRMECVNDEERDLLQKFRSMTKDAQEALQETIIHERTRTKKDLRQENTFQTKAVDLQGSNAQVSGKNLPEFISTPEMPASPVSSFSASVAVLDSVMEKAKIYQKLLKVGVPPEGVLDKMKKENVDSRIVNYVLGGQNDTVLSDQEAKIAAKYQKMLSVGLPIEAVRHKMTQDQIVKKIIDFVEASSTPVSNGSPRVWAYGENKAAPTNEAADEDKKAPPTTELTDEEETVAQTYRKMLKVGLEVDAVRHKMTNDQVAENIVLAVVGKLDVQKPSEKKTMEHKVKGIVDLSEEEETLSVQYKRLLKLQIPRDQLESRMRHEGASEKVISSVLGAPSAASRDGILPSNSLGSKLVSLHWTPLSGDQLNNSVWKAAKALKTEDADPSKLVELFQRKPKSAKPKTVRNDDGGSIATKARLIDLNRSNNVAISLKAFKDFSYAELCNIIMFLDPCKKLEGERIPFLRDLLPTQTEIKAVSDYTGSNDRLVPAEIWFRQISSIKRIETKVKVMRTMEMLQVEAREVGENLSLFTRVCNQVLDSEKLQDLLAMVLVIGNMLNEGTRSGRAAGFKFDSLLKLTQTKSTDGTTTVLDYLVALYAGKGERETLNLIADFPDCQTASRMLLSDLIMEVKSIQESLDQCKAELSDLKKDAIRRKGHTPPAPVGVPRPKTDPRTALFQSIKERQSHQNGQDSVVQKSVEKPRDILGSMRQDGDNETEVPPFVLNEISRFESSDKNTIFGAIERLQSFTEIAEVSVGDLENLKKEAIAASKELSRFCGEGQNTGATSTLLGVLSQFASNLESALKKYDEKCAVAAKRTKGRAGGTDTEIPEETSPDSIPAEKSLIMMVSNMLKNANEETRENFRRGRFIHNPTAEMQAIYERESHVEHPKGERRRRDLASAIKEKSEGVDQGEVQDARSKFASPDKLTPSTFEYNQSGIHRDAEDHDSRCSYDNKDPERNGERSSSSVLQAVKKLEGRPCPEALPRGYHESRKMGHSGLRKEIPNQGRSCSDKIETVRQTTRGPNPESWQNLQRRPTEAVSEVASWDDHNVPLSVARSERKFEDATEPSTQYSMFNSVTFENEGEQTNNEETGTMTILDIGDRRIDNNSNNDKNNNKSDQQVCTNTKLDSVNSDANEEDSTSSSGTCTELGGSIEEGVGSREKSMVPGLRQEDWSIDEMKERQKTQGRTSSESPREALSSLVISIDSHASVSDTHRHEGGRKVLDSSTHLPTHGPVATARESDPENFQDDDTNHALRAPNGKVNAESDHNMSTPAETNTKHWVNSETKEEDCDVSSNPGDSERNAERCGVSPGSSAALGTEVLSFGTVQSVPLDSEQPIKIQSKPAKPVIAPDNRSEQGEKISEHANTKGLEPVVGSDNPADEGEPSNKTANNSETKEEDCDVSSKPSDSETNAERCGVSPGSSAALGTEVMSFGTVETVPLDSEQPIKIQSKPGKPVVAPDNRAEQGEKISEHVKDLETVAGSDNRADEEEPPNKTANNSETKEEDCDVSSKPGDSETNTERCGVSPGSSASLGTEVMSFGTVESVPLDSEQRIKIQSKPVKPVVAPDNGAEEGEKISEHAKDLAEPVVGSDNRADEDEPSKKTGLDLAKLVVERNHSAENGEPGCKKRPDLTKPVVPDDNRGEDGESERNDGVDRGKSVIPSHDQAKEGKPMNKNGAGPAKSLISLDNQDEKGELMTNNGADRGKLVVQPDNRAERGEMRIKNGADTAKPDVGPTEQVEDREQIRNSSDDPAIKHTYVTMDKLAMQDKQGIDEELAGKNAEDQGEGCASHGHSKPAIGDSSTASNFGDFSSPSKHHDGERDSSESVENIAQVEYIKSITLRSLKSEENTNKERDELVKPAETSSFCGESASGSTTISSANSSFDMRSRGLGNHVGKSNDVRGNSTHAAENDINKDTVGLSTTLSGHLSIGKLLTKPSSELEAAATNTRSCKNDHASGLLSRTKHDHQRLSELTKHDSYGPSLPVSEKEARPLEKVFDLSGSTQRLSMVRDKSPLREIYRAAQPRLDDEHTTNSQHKSTGSAKGIKAMAQTLRWDKSSGTTMSAPSVLSATTYVNTKGMKPSDRPVEKSTATGENRRSTFADLARQRRMGKHDTKDFCSVSGDRHVSPMKHPTDEKTNFIIEELREAPRDSRLVDERASEGTSSQGSKIVPFEKKARELREAKKTLRA